MSDDVKPRRRRWRVTLYNPLAFRAIGDASLYTSAFCVPNAEASTMGRAFQRVLTAAGAEFLQQEPREGLPPQPGYDYRDTARNCYEAARAGMMRYPGNAAVVSVQHGGFTVAIERVR